MKKFLLGIFGFLLVSFSFSPLHSQIIPVTTPAQVKTPPTSIATPTTPQTPAAMPLRNPTSSIAQVSLSDLQKRVFNLQSQLNDLNVYLSSLQTQLNSIIHDSKDPQEKRQLQVNDLQKKLMDTDTKLQSIRSDLTTLDSEIKSMLAQKPSGDTDTKDIPKNLGSLEERVSRIEADVQKILGTNPNSKDALVSTDNTRKDIENHLIPELQSGEAMVSSDQNAVKIKLSGDILFREGEVSLSLAGQEVLQKIAPTLQNLKDKVVVVIGHADTKPIGKNLSDFYPTNWELSTTRGSMVVRYLEDLGVDPSILLAAGRSFHNPTQNGIDSRRAEIWIFPKLFS